MAKPKAEAAIRATVEGRVRGVGFRDATVARARELGLTGWVRHAVDGDGLAVHAEGEAEAVAALERFLREGPGGAEVASVSVDRVEPEGHEQFAIRGVSAGRFTVVELARGFELRLDLDGGVRAWAVPKAPSLDPAAKRMVIELDAPTGEKGETWDEGDYEQGGRVPWPEAIDRGHAVFVLHGDRLRGGFALQRTGGGSSPRWLLIKRRDEEARPGSDGS